MTKKQELVETEGGALATVPDFLADYGREGLDDVGEYKNTPRLKIVQAQSDPELQDEFEVGSLIIVPDRILLAKFDQQVPVVPVYFWPSWAKWRDANEPGANMAPVVEETQDRDHPVAVMARDPQRREEAYPDNPKYTYRYQEQLNYAVWLADGTVAALTYSSGSHAIGRRLNGYLERRGCPIWANRLLLEPGKKTNAKKQQYYVIEFAPDTRQPFIPKDQVDAMRNLYQGFADAHRSGGLGLADPSGAAPAD
jgi:hypothetical protein